MDASHGNVSLPGHMGRGYSSQHWLNSKHLLERRLLNRTGGDLC